MSLFKKIEEVVKQAARGDEYKGQLKGRTIHTDSAGKEIVPGMIAVTSKNVVFADNPIFEKENVVTLPIAQVHSITHDKEKNKVVVSTPTEVHKLSDFGKEEDAKKLVDTFNKIKNPPAEGAELTLSVKNLVFKQPPLPK